jgi:threonine dehydrogenase-like Zn-dependent dehydrogenase
MRAIVIDLNLARAALTLLLSRISKSAFYGPLSIISYRSDYPEPKLPGDEWVKVRSKLTGICGSDLRLITLSESFYLYPLTSFPIIPGHEVVGFIEKLGSKVEGFEEGERVVMDPVLPCRVRGFEDCNSCRRGEFASCNNLDRGNISPGIFTGFCRDTGGSWADYFVAHQFQLFKIPEKIKDENAVFIEPFSVAIHAVLKDFPEDGQSVAVIGCGTMGLCVIAALKSLGFKGDVVGIDVSEAQLEMAKSFGANKIIRADANFIEDVAAHTDGRVYHPPRDKPMFVDGGFDTVFECVGNAETVDSALRIAKPLGNVVLVGTAAKLNVDWAPIFSKQLKIIGTFGCGIEKVDGKVKRTFDVAIELIQKVDFSRLLTHKFPLEEYKKALWASMNRKESGAMKVAFTCD